MSALMDLVVILIMGLCVFTGIKKGFIKSLMGLAKYILCIAAAFLFTNSLASWIRESFLDKMIGSHVTKQVASILNVNTSSSTDDILGKINLQKLIDDAPDVFTNFIKKYNITNDQLQSIVENSNQNSVTETVNQEIINQIASPLSGVLSKIIALIVIVLLVGIICTIVTIILNNVFRLPILNSFNTLGGAAVGLIKGFLIVLLICASLNLALPFLKNTSILTIDQTAVDKTHIYKHFSNTGLLGSILKTK